VDAQAAALGASKSDWWPTVFINGSIGFASHKLDQFIHQNSLTYEIAPTISWKLFQGTQLIQATRQAKAQLDESIRQFNQDVLTAVQEVDNAMNAYKYSIKQIVSLREVVNQSKQTLDLSLDLYKQGLTPFQNVLDAQRSLFTYEQDLVQAEGSSLLYLIQLYQALGGGWNNQYNQ
jgi:outer membrane protein TolC